MMTHQNFWKLLGTVKKLKEKDNRCFVCGSTENIVAHHIRKVEQDCEEYYSENNLVLLCDYHHHLYHRQYPNVNPKTFAEFLKKNHSKKPKNRGVKMNFTLDKELKISKLKKIMKLLNKTNSKLVKVSVNGKLYDISKVTVIDKYATFELKDFSLIKKAGE